MPPVEQKNCKKWSTDLYLDFDFLGKSKSVLWQDITPLWKSANYWRLSVFRASNNALEATTSKADAIWNPKSQKTLRFTLPLEVLLAADFEFCSNDTSTQCEKDAKPKIESRKIPFLMHTYPEPPPKKNT
jgi:hypothetical protein